MKSTRVLSGRVVAIALVIAFLGLVPFAEIALARPDECGGGCSTSPKYFDGYVRDNAGSPLKGALVRATYSITICCYATYYYDEYAYSDATGYYQLWPSVASGVVLYRLDVSKYRYWNFWMDRYGPGRVDFTLPNDQLTYYFDAMVFGPSQYVDIIKYTQTYTHSTRVYAYVAGYPVKDYTNTETITSGISCTKTATNACASVQRRNWVWGTGRLHIDYSGRVVIDNAWVYCGTDVGCFNGVYAQDIGSYKAEYLASSVGKSVPDFKVQPGKSAEGDFPETGTVTEGIAVAVNVGANYRGVSVSVPLTVGQTTTTTVAKAVYWKLTNTASADKCFRVYSEDNVHGYQFVHIFEIACYW